MFYTTVSAEGVVLKIKPGEAVNSSDQTILTRLGIEEIVDNGEDGVTFRVNPEKVDPESLPVSLDIARRDTEFSMFRYAQVEFKVEDLHVRIKPQGRA